MQILLTLAYSLLFIFLIGKMNFFRIPGISVRLLQCGYLLKLSAGIAVGLIYTYYYTDRLTADTFKFFDDSSVLFNSIYSSPGDYLKMLTGIGASDPHLDHYYDTMKNWYDTFSPFNDNRTMIRLNAFIRLFSMGFYYVHVAIICFLSYAGIVAIVKVFTREYPLMTLEIFLATLLLPSVLFWGSGLLKDALVFFAFGMLLLIVDKLIYKTKKNNIHYFLFLIFFFLLMITKFQVFLISIPLLTAWIFSVKFKKNAFVVFTCVSILFVFSIIALPLITPELDLINLLVQKQKSFLELAANAEAGSAISIPLLQPDIPSMIVNAPIGFITSLTRPFITDTGGILNIISAVENLFILLFGIFCLVKIKTVNFKGKTLPAFCLFYTLYSFTLIGMITPVLGAIVRYKAQALPFLVILFIITAHPAVKRALEKFLPTSII